MPTLGSGRTMLSSVYPDSFLGHYSHLPPPCSGISKATGSEPSVGSWPSMPRAFCAVHPHALPYRIRTGIPSLWAVLPKGADPPCLLHQTVTAQPLPGIRGLSCRAVCFLLCPLTNENDNGNHIYRTLIMCQTRARVPQALSPIFIIIL